MSEYEYDMIVDVAEKEWNRLYGENKGSFCCQPYEVKQKFITKTIEEMKRR